MHTTHSGNIGGVARAMKNMGLRNLVLVKPLEYPAPEAQWRAASALDVLESARIVETLEEAIGDSQFVVGTSARGRRIPWPILDARACAQRIATQSQLGERVSIVFGREDRGLLNEELQLCNLHCHIPSHEDYPALNLAMAVQVIAYELRMCQLEGHLPTEQDAQWDAPFSTQEDMARFYAHLETVLVEIGFLDPAAPRQLMPRLMRLFNRVRIDEMELNILRGILKETQKSIAKARER
jgi:tRNA (cytidine32/uridine32-2'-O)-methyltransferase